MKTVHLSLATCHLSLVIFSLLAAAPHAAADEVEEEIQTRLRRGLARAKDGDDEAAVRELEAVTRAAEPGSPARNLALYVTGQAESGLGETERARAAFAALVAEAPESDLARGARRWFEDLDKVGKPAPSPVEGGPRAITFTAESGEAARPWRVPAFPRTYVVDAHGIVRAAGVRGAAIARAVERARCACHPSR